jgi:hypothetical protein
MSDLIPWMEPWSGRALVIGVCLLGLLIALRGFARSRCTTPTCPTCGYNRSQSTSSICPECGGESTSPADLLRRPRRWRLVVIGLLVAMAMPVFVAQRRIRDYGWSYYTYIGPIQWIDPYRTVDSLEIADVTFEVERERLPWSFGGRVVIHDGDGARIVTSDTDIGYRRWTILSNRAGRPGRLSRDATHIALQSWSGGAHCCFTYWIYEVRGGRASRIAVLDAGNSEMAFKDVNGDGLDEITLVDDAFAYWNACFACSPKPRVLLRLNDAELTPAWDLMQPSGDDLARLLQLLDELPEAWSNHEMGDNGVPVIVWRVMLDLIYAGRAGEAFELIARTWPAEGPDLEAFEQEFLAQLATSQWAEDLAAMNGGEFAERLLPFIGLTQQRSASADR